MAKRNKQKLWLGAALYIVDRCYRSAELAKKRARKMGYEWTFRSGKYFVIERIYDKAK